MTDIASRIADEDIYLVEDRFDQPKELFKFIVARIEAEQRPVPASVLDVGCATGEFLYYLGQRLPGRRLHGFDVAEKLIERARTRNDQVEFWAASALDQGATGGRTFDVITCTGVLACFDENEVLVALANLLSWMSDGGSLFVHSQFNEYPIDVVMKCRRTTSDGPQAWETGWNIYSRQMIENALAAYDSGLQWSWHTWEMPFAIERRDDPMRVWTIRTEDNPHQRVNGAGQFVHTELLHICHPASAD